MLLFYIRHGEPIYEPDSLTDLGYKQADALVARLQKVGLDKIYSSSSNRALLTARPTAEALGMDINILDWCNESHAWQDLTVRLSDGSRKWCWAYPPIRDFFNSEEIRTLGYKWYEHPYFKNTSYKEGMMRIENETYSFLSSLGYVHSEKHGGYIAKRPNDERIALFAHQGFGLAFLSAVLCIPYPSFSTHFDTGYTGVTVIDFPGNALVIPRMLQLSNDSHIFASDMKTVYNNKIEF